MSKYHYNVHVIASNGNDFSMWVGVTIDHKCDPSDHCCPNGSDLGKAAIARASELCPSVIGWECEEWNGGYLVRGEYTRITEEQRSLAQRLWNEYNNTLKEHGMRLHYDSQDGGFFVASTDLVPGHSGDDGALSYDELVQVVTDGGFDREALNNPPWFTDYNRYTLKTK